MNKILCAVVVDEHDNILSYTCQATKEQVEEWARENFCAWDKLKELGARVVQAELVVDE